ncbi:MAG: bifunctional serine/threonine-protein kinase/formylglycine-generating enzyme family protein [Prevotellaceae bacterium]|nr:bifunctional serine/threonine-protein kinase/formylglycine-generating enzyme family protein [Prevotellaceae bacterium]
MQNLKVGSTLQGGRYKITSILGQGGFGITYLAIQSGLERKVAVKEFFMKELCERDETTSHVTIGTEGSRETVNRFREKFLKEARHIAKFNHPNIVRVIDVFDENATSYYVMEYIGNGSLSDKVKQKDCLSEDVATRYILEVAAALDYIHGQKMNHLDVKPGNIMLNETDDCVLIDFGLSKQYDAATEKQTSTTPVGISEGYAPMEQYKRGGVGEFSPETDIYALGATFFNLLTGERPPSASDVNEDGVPVDKLKAKGVSDKAIAVICKAMESRKKDRMKRVSDFIAGLEGKIVPPKSPKLPKEEPRSTFKEKPKADNDETIIKETEKKKKEEAQQSEKQKKKKETPAKPKIKSPFKFKRTFLWVAAIAIVAIAGVLVVNNLGGNNEKSENDINENDIFVLEETVGDDKVFTVADVKFVMKFVEGGTFTMGSTPEQQGFDDDEKPTHQVTLSSYYIGEIEVTQALWTAVMGNNPSYFKGENNPVEKVSWNDCQKFIKKLNSLTGKNFRFPTESEWEYAARGGNKSKGYQYSGSNNIDDVAWYDDNSGSKTHPVKTKQPNELGIYDMSGNVWEWCYDWKGDYSSDSQVNPQGPFSGFYRVDRGGSWLGSAEGCRSADRGNDAPGNRYSNLGLRLVLSE